MATQDQACTEFGVKRRAERTISFLWPGTVRSTIAAKIGTVPEISLIGVHPPHLDGYPSLASGGIVQLETPFSPLPAVLRPLNILAILLLAAPAVGDGAPPTGATSTAKPAGRLQQLKVEVARLIGELDSERFDDRRAAAARLETMVGQPELAPWLSAEFRRWLLRADISFEVRWRLEQWVRRLPPTPLPPAASVSDAELDRVVRQLDDESYAARRGAVERLEWLLSNPKLVGPLLLRLKRRLADTAQPADAEGPLESAWKRAWGAWLLSEPSASMLPPASDEQIRQWVDDLARPTPAGKRPGRWRLHRTARRELLVLLASDRCTPRVVQALQARLDQGLEAAAAARLQDLLDLTKPAMVAEYWYGRRHLGEQHLIVGVPLMSPGATRPSYFDRVDEHTAHCVSGNSLSPGDYPVGVAFPHPKQPGAMFHLVNLPTPRRRLAYAYYVQTDQATRLAALSRRTLDRFLADKHLLTEPELRMLAGLDPREVSRFAGRYFLLVEDGPQTGPPAAVTGGQPSRFGRICAQLAIDGTQEATAGLTEAIAQRRFLPPTPASPYRLEWLAALSLATRDPWPGVDEWLAGQIGNQDTLRESSSAHRPPTPDEGDDSAGKAAPRASRTLPAAEIGATAAALLLKRHGERPADFKLVPIHDPLMLSLHLDGYRFQSPQSPARVQQWWNRQPRSPQPSSRDHQ